MCYMPTPRFKPYNDNVAVFIESTTLLKKRQLNLPLLKALKKQGINNLYLLNDIGFTTHSLAHHFVIYFDVLMEMGFYVRGCLTPQDLLWKVGTQDNPGRFLKDVFNQKPPTLPKDFDLRRESPGSAFRDAILDIKTRQDYTLGAYLHFKSLALNKQAKELNCSYPHIKGMMFNLFLLRFNRYEFQRILIIDNDDKALETFEHFVPLSSHITLPPYATLKVDSFKTPEETYEKKLLSYPMLVIPMIQRAISDHIYEHLFGSNPFLKSSEPKKAILRRLSDALRCNRSEPPLTVAEIIDTCLKKPVLPEPNPQITAEKILSTHRNRFLSSKRNKETDTMLLINEIKKIFGEVELPANALPASQRSITKSA